MVLRAVGYAGGVVADVSAPRRLLPPHLSATTPQTVKCLSAAGCRVLATARDVAAGERIITTELAGGPACATAYAGNAVSNALPPHTVYVLCFF